MEQVFYRRFALVLAAFSFGALMAVMLGCSVALQTSALQLPRVAESTATAQDPSFPLVVEGTALQVELIASYEGIFWEDRSGDQVFNVASIMVRNTGDALITQACVVLYTDHGSMTFAVEMIPAGEAVLVPEISRAPYEECQIVGISGTVDMLSGIDSPISVAETGMAELTVYNHSGDPLRNVVIYHKAFLPENGICIGGLSYKTVIDYIGAYETVVIKPDYYASGYSHVVYVSGEA